MFPALVLLFSAILPFFFIPLAFYSPTRVQPSLPGHMYARFHLLTNIGIPTTDISPPLMTSIQLLPSTALTAAVETPKIVVTTVTAVTTKITTDIVVYVPPDYHTTDFYSVLGTVLPLIFIILILHRSGIVSSPAATPTPLTSTPLSSPQPPVPSFPAQTAPSSPTAESVHHTPEPASPDFESDLPLPLTNNASKRNLFKGAYRSTPLGFIRCVNQSNDYSDSTVLFGLDQTATTTTSSVPDLSTNSDLEASSNLSLKKPANANEEELAEPLSPARLFSAVSSEFSQEPLVVLAPPGPLIAPAIPITLGYQGWPGVIDPLNVTALPPSPATPLPSNWSQACQPTDEGDRLSPGALLSMACNDYYSSFLMNSGYKREPLAAYDPATRPVNEKQDTVPKSPKSHFDGPPGSTCDAILADIMASIRRTAEATSLRNESLSGVPPPDLQPRPTADVLDESLSHMEHPVCPPSPPSPSPSQQPPSPPQQPPSPPPQSQDPPIPSAMAQAAGAMKVKSKLRQPMRRPLAVALIIGRSLGPPSKLRQPTPRPVWVDAIVEKYGTPSRPRYPSATAPRRVALKMITLTSRK